MRYPTPDFFVCNLFESLPYFKSDIASLEHPVFSLSTKRDMRVLHYEHNGNTITIKPSYEGLATIHDKDVLIYCAGYLRAAINQGEIPNRTVQFTAYDFFTSTNRKTDGDTYQRFKNSLERLSGTRIQTNIKTGGLTIEEGFGIINAWRAVKEDSGRVISAEIELSKWFYNSIIENEVLTINPDYFHLRKPIERRVYEISRKHCGDADSFKIGLDKLKKKVGSKSNLREFRRIIGKIIETNHLPDYEVHLLDNDIVNFTNRNFKDAIAAPQSPFPFLKTDTYEKARKAAPGFDIYNLEQQWREWIAKKKKEPPKRPDAAFVAFCRKKAAVGVQR